MNWKKLLLVIAAVAAFGFAAVPRSEAGLSVGIGIGSPYAYGYGSPYTYGYGSPYSYGYGYPYGYSGYGGYSYLHSAYSPYGYGYGYRPVVGVYVRPHYHWRHHRRVYCTMRHRYGYYR